MKSILKFIMLILLQFVMPELNAQSNSHDFVLNYNDSTSDGYKKKSKLLAEQQIRDLKSGCIIFLLSTKKNSIDALNNSGNKELAKQVADEQFQLNQKIVTAFKTNFNFCPVYFAFVDDIEQIKTGNTSGLLLNADLQRDASVKPVINYFLFAEYGQLYTETAGFVGNKVDTNYVEQGQVFMENCFLLKDLSRYQLKDPFPYYVSCGNINAAAKKVKKLNANISNYYATVSGNK